MKIKHITNGYMRGKVRVAILRLHPEKYLYKGELYVLRETPIYKMIRNAKVYVISTKIIDGESYIVFQLDNDKYADKIEKENNNE